MARKIGTSTPAAAADAGDDGATPAAPRNQPQAPAATRVLWKGAISFGLVHIPVALYSATVAGGLDFDWLDRRTLDPVGYKRINKKTGKDIASEDIVKGIEYEDGRYVVLTPDEIAKAYPKTTQTIEIEAFIDAADVPFVYFERPYYIAPINRGEKVYALLREVLAESHRVGVARVVIQTKQHLAVLVPSGPALVLNLLRWGGEIRSFEALKLPPVGAKAAGLRESELHMARQLVDDMTAPWDADRFRDSFKEEILRLVEQKAQAGEAHPVARLEPAAPPAGAEVIDLTELLRRSLGGGAAKPADSEEQAADEKPAKAPRAKAAAKTAKPAAKAAASAKAPPKAPAPRRKAA